MTLFPAKSQKCSIFRFKTNVYMLRSKDKNLKDPVSFLFILNKRTTNWLNEMQKGI